MAKASDYRTIARSVASVWVRARLINDELLSTRLVSALEIAITRALRLAELEARAKVEGK